MTRQARWTFAAALALAAGAGVAFAEGEPRPGGQGRYVIVNPFPQSVRNTMLLDTITGQTWITCSSGGEIAWCGPLLLSRGGVTATTREP